MPIQGSSSDMVKIAMIEFRRWINKNNYRDVIRPFVQLHDEIAISCHISMKEIASKKLVEVMEDAATTVLKNKLLKADLEIHETW